MFTKFCAALSKISLVLAVVGLLSVVLCVQWQVFGRYVLNDTPTWAEALAMLIVLFVTAFGLGVGVRDAGHIGMESLIVLLPEKWRVRLELVIHSVVGCGPVPSGKKRSPCCLYRMALTMCPSSLRAH